MWGCHVRVMHVRRLLGMLRSGSGTIIHMLLFLGGLSVRSWSDRGGVIDVHVRVKLDLQGWLRNWANWSQKFFKAERDALTIV